MLKSYGRSLPQSEADFRLLVATSGQRFASCVSCTEVFDHTNTHSPEGWQETQISGMCEDCFDRIFSDKEE